MFAPVLRQNPIAFCDIGARGGFDPDLLPVAFGVLATGFEPDPDEFARLKTSDPGPWLSATLLPTAIGAKTGPHQLHIPREPEGASLLPPLENLPLHLSKDQYFNIERTVPVNTVTLDHLIAKTEMMAPDCLKSDIEGLELAVLQASPLALANLLAVKMEVAFVELRQGQPIAGEIQTFMSANGFYLMDLMRPAHWRSSGYVTHPHAGKENIPYSRGQLIQGDFLFLKKIEVLATEEPVPIHQILKLVMLSMSYGYFDYAADILKHPRVVSRLMDHKLPDLLDSLAICSRRYGRLVARREFRRHVRLLGPYLRRLPDLILK